MHRTLGRNKCLTLSKTHSTSFNHIKSAKTLFSDEIKGISYIGRINKSDPPQYDFHSCQICLITTEHKIIKLGGNYGEFLMTNQEQRIFFKKLLVKLKSKLGISSEFPLDTNAAKSQSFLHSWTIWKIFIWNIPFFIIIILWFLFLAITKSQILKVEISNMIFYPLIELTLTRWIYDISKFGRWALQKENPEFFENLST
jgi:hypothetical protein